MSFTHGRALKISVFGSSHGELVGSVLDGLPSGLRVDTVNMRKWLERRRPGQSALTTQRKEEDAPEIVSGISQGYTDGGPLTIIIRNRDTISSHYDEMKDRPRPGHGDLTLFYKYGDHRNYRGGGFLSGRMTAPLVAAGSVTLALLESSGLAVSSYIDRMGEISLPDSASPPTEDPYAFESRMPDAACNARAVELIRKLLKEGDSIGATIRTVITGVPPGIGEPFFDSVESCLSHLLFSIPGLKGIEFGSGFGFSGMKGTEANDPYSPGQGGIVTTSNHNGGILGGISSGMPIIFRVAMKPTSSIRREQATVNLSTGKPDRLSVRGRHDPCIAIRAVPVVQTLSTIALADLMLRSGKIPRVIRQSS